MSVSRRWKAAEALSETTTININRRWYLELLSVVCQSSNGVFLWMKFHVGSEGAALFLPVGTVVAKLPGTGPQRVVAVIMDLQPSSCLLPWSTLDLLSSSACASPIWTQPFLTNLTFWLDLRPASSLWAWGQSGLSPDPDDRHQTCWTHPARALWDHACGSKGTATSLGSSSSAPVEQPPLATPESFCICHWILRFWQAIMFLLLIYQ